MRAGKIISVKMDLAVKTKGFQLVIFCNRERQTIAKAMRQKDKKLKELMIQIEDERKQTEQFKDQV